MNWFTALGILFGALSALFLYLGQSQDSQRDKNEIISSGSKNAESVKAHVDKRVNAIDKRIDAITVQLKQSNARSIEITELLLPSLDAVKKDVKVGNESIKILTKEFEEFRAQTSSVNKLTGQDKEKILERLLVMSETVNNIPKEKHSSPLQSFQNAIEVATEYVANEKFVQSRNSNGTINIELPISTLKNDSRVKLLSSILDDPETIALARRQQTSNQIQQAHESLMHDLAADLDSMMSGWKHIAHDYAMKVYGHEIGSMIGAGSSGYSSDFSPELLGYPKFEREPTVLIKQRFNLGNINTSPLIEIAVYVDYRPDQWEQHYVILGAYIPKKSPSPFLPKKITDSKIEVIDYRSSEAKEKLRRELSSVFFKLDKILTEG